MIRKPFRRKQPGEKSKPSSLTGTGLFRIEDEYKKLAGSGVKGDVERKKDLRAIFLSTANGRRLAEAAKSRVKPYLNAWLKVNRRSVKHMSVKEKRLVVADIMTKANFGVIDRKEISSIAPVVAAREFLERHLQLK